MIRPHIFYRDGYWRVSALRTKPYHKYRKAWNAAYEHICKLNRNR